MAVGDIDGDVLLPLGAKTVDQPGEVDLAVAVPQAGRRHGRDLIVKGRLGVVEQPPDQRALAIIDAARRRQPQQFDVEIVGDRMVRDHQKYPTRLRSSMAASERRSSPRVPRSVRFDDATSAITSAIVAAADSTAPVQVASPTVRKRTRRRSTPSPGRGAMCGVLASRTPSRMTTSRSCAK